MIPNAVTPVEAHALLCPATGLSENCRAAGCMAWRWTKDGRGYCGVAGNPEIQPIMMALVNSLPTTT